MAESWGPTAANAALDALFVSHPWLQMHVGPPGAAGTSNVAVNNTRKNVSAAMAAASGGSKASNATVDWTNVAGTEQYTHCTLWSLAAGGTFGASGDTLANPVTAGDNFSIPVAQLVAALVLAS